MEDTGFSRAAMLALDLKLKFRDRQRPQVKHQVMDSTKAQSYWCKTRRLLRKLYRAARGVGLPIRLIAERARGSAPRAPLRLGMHRVAIGMWIMG